MLSQYVAALVVTCLTHLVLAVVVYLRSSRRLTHVTFALYAFAIAWWSLFEALAIAEPDLVEALRLWRICHLAVVFIPIFFLHFVLSLGAAAERAARRPIILGFYVVGLVCAWLSTTPLFLAEAVPKFSFRSFGNPGPLYPWFFGFWMAIAAYGVFIWLPQQFLRATGLRRQQLKYLCLSWLATFVGGAPNFLPVFDIEVPLLMPYGTFIVPLNAVVTTYAIARYRLLDIHIALTRTTTFMLVYLALLGLPLIGALLWQQELAAQLGPRWWVWLWVIGGLLGTAAHYINGALQRRAEARVLREQRRYQAILLQASQGMTQVRDLRRLLSLIVHMVTKTVGLTHAAIFLEDTRDGSFALRAHRYRKLLPAAARLTADDPLTTVLRQGRQPVVLEELQLQAGESVFGAPSGRDDLAAPLARMHELSAGLIVPGLIERELRGFLVLGAKRNGRLFSAQDIAVFTTLVDQAAVAIENARFYEEEKHRQAAFFHTASLARLGTMASSMSHQVNNRFNVVSVISSMQKLKIQDVLRNATAEPGALHAAVQECLSRFESLEEEALRGGQIVSAIRKMVRPSSGEHKPLSIGSAVQSGLDVLKYKVHFSELDVRLDLPADVPNVFGDQAQLGECFLNLLDNAYDAIQSRLDQRPVVGGQGAIRIAARAVDEDGRRWVVVDVSDNGVGMTEKELAGIFIPFFTTKATAEKGTGLGLYVMRKILEAHGGSISVASREGQGTTFTMRLPAMSDGMAAGTPGPAGTGAG